VTESRFEPEPVIPVGNGGLVRLRLDISYDGTDFAGWAPQPDQRTVADVIEVALATILRLERPARLVVAGRTDAGVHATGQVAHVDVPALVDAGVWAREAGQPGEPVDPALVARRLAGVLPEDVRVRRVSLAAPGFQARFAALGRRYAYRVGDGVPNPLRRRDTVSWPRPLDEAAMAASARALVGQHDFAAYCKPRPGATTIRTLHELSVRRDDESVIVIGAHADAFCHNQIRSMVGALLAVGEGRQSLDWPGTVLASGVRDPLVNVAPPHGLTLVGVDYPPDDELAARAELTRRRRSTLASTHADPRRA
jgi:tRNA pseudouridine38-40 synthase